MSIMLQNFLRLSRYTRLGSRNHVVNVTLALTTHHHRVRVPYVSYTQRHSISSVHNQSLHQTAISITQARCHLATLATVTASQPAITQLATSGIEERRGGYQKKRRWNMMPDWLFEWLEHVKHCDFDKADTVFVQQLPKQRIEGDILARMVNSIRDATESDAADRRVRMLDYVSSCIVGVPVESLATLQRDFCTPDWRNNMDSIPVDTGVIARTIHWCLSESPEDGSLQHEERLRAREKATNAVLHHMRMYWMMPGLRTKLIHRIIKMARGRALRQPIELVRGISSMLLEDTNPTTRARAPIYIPLLELFVTKNQVTEAMSLFRKLLEKHQDGELTLSFEHIVPLMHGLANHGKGSEMLSVYVASLPVISAPPSSESVSRIAQWVTSLGIKEAAIVSLDLARRAGKEVAAPNELDILRLLHAYAYQGDVAGFLRAANVVSQSGADEQTCASILAAACHSLAWRPSLAYAYADQSKMRSRCASIVEKMKLGTASGVSNVFAGADEWESMTIVGRAPLLRHTRLLLKCLRTPTVRSKQSPATSNVQKDSALCSDSKVPHKIAQVLAAASADEWVSGGPDVLLRVVAKASKLMPAALAQEVGATSPDASLLVTFFRSVLHSVMARSWFIHHNVNRLPAGRLEHHIEYTMQWCARAVLALTFVCHSMKSNHIQCGRSIVPDSGVSFRTASTKLNDGVAFRSSQGASMEPDAAMDAVNRLVKKLKRSIRGQTIWNHHLRLARDWIDEHHDTLALLSPPILPHQHSPEPIERLQILELHTIALQTLGVAMQPPQLPFPFSEMLNTTGVISRGRRRLNDLSDLKPKFDFDALSILDASIREQIQSTTANGNNDVDDDTSESETKTEVRQLQATEEPDHGMGDLAVPNGWLQDLFVSSPYQHSHSAIGMWSSSIQTRSGELSAASIRRNHMQQPKLVKLHQNDQLDRSFQRVWSQMDWSESDRTLSCTDDISLPLLGGESPAVLQQSLRDVTALFMWQVYRDVEATHASFSEEEDLAPPALPWHASRQLKPKSSTKLPASLISMIPAFFVEMYNYRESNANIDAGPGDGEWKRRITWRAAQQLLYHRIYPPL
jgi:hypothetical protein